MIFGWLRRRRLRAAVEKQWTTPKKIVEYANPHGTTDVVVSLMDKNYAPVLATIDIERNVIRVHLPADYDETSLTVKIYG